MTTVAVKERPILFSAPMIRALLEGRKTQTRRVVKFNASGRVKLVGSHMNWHLQDPDAIKACPYGVPGDRLWVKHTLWESECGRYFARQVHEKAWGSFDVIDRETHDVWMSPRYAPTGFDDTDRRYTHPEFARLVSSYSLIDGPDRKPIRFELGFGDHDQSKPIKPFSGNTAIRSYTARFLRQRSSIHMPHWASRITLEITDVRVQRVQNISEDDAIAEGVEGAERYPPGQPDGVLVTPREQYMIPWDSINGTGSWLSNPWVWAITFKVIKP